MDAETYEMIQETMVREAVYRNEREMNRQRGDTYCRRALCLTRKLSREHDNVRRANRVAEKMRLHAGEVEQELADALAVNESLAALLRRAYHELISIDGNIRREQDRPDPILINEIGKEVGPYSLPAHVVGKE